MPRAPSKIHVQSRRGPAGPPLLFAHQEKMTPDGPGALYFTERGSGPSFLLVHGLMVSGEMFKPVIDRLRRHLCAMFTQGIPLAAFEVTDIKGEFARLTAKGADSNVVPAGIGKPALRALAAAGIQASKMWRAQTKTISWRFMAVGPRAIRILKAALKARWSRGRAKPGTSSNW
jgi:hypothetical protein